MIAVAFTIEVLQPLTGAQRERLEELLGHELAPDVKAIELGADPDDRATRVWGSLCDEGIKCAIVKTERVEFKADRP